MSRRRPRWWLRALVTLVVLGVVAGAAELGLRILIPHVIASTVREQLGLAEDHPVDVSLGGSALGYALTGRVGRVSVDIDDAALVEGLRGDVSLHADAVPFNFAEGEISGARAELTVDRAQLPTAISLLTSGLADGAEVRDGELVVTRTMELFGATVPLSASLSLSVEAGDVRIEPRSVTAAGFDLTAEEIRAASGGAMDELLSPHLVCVRDRLPAGITLERITLSGSGSVTIAVAIDPGIISDPAEREPGTCAE